MARLDGVQWAVRTNEMDLELESMERRPLPPGEVEQTTMWQSVMLLTGIQLFLVKPSDYSLEGPRSRSLCPGLLWLPCGIALIASQVAVVSGLLSRAKEQGSGFYEGLGIALVPPAIFWGQVALSVLLFRVRRPHKVQWDQFTDDIIHWIPVPGLLTFLLQMVVLVGGLQLSRAMGWV